MHQEDLYLKFCFKGILQQDFYFIFLSDYFSFAKYSSSLSI